jgi:hypothetical protein
MTSSRAQQHSAVFETLCFAVPSVAAQVLAVAVHNHYKRLQNKRMGRSAYPYEGSLANVPSSQLVRRMSAAAISAIAAERDSCTLPRLLTNGR